MGGHASRSHAFSLPITRRRGSGSVAAQSRHARARNTRRAFDLSRDVNHASELAGLIHLSPRLCNKKRRNTNTKILGEMAQKRQNVYSPKGVNSTQLALPRYSALHSSTQSQVAMPPTTINFSDDGLTTKHCCLAISREPITTHCPPTSW